MSENNIETFDLAKELEIPTQERNFNVIQEAETIQPIDDNSEFNAEFDADKLKEVAAEKVADNFEAAYDSSTLAPAIVDGADALIVNLFPILYEKSAFSDDQRAALKVLAYKIQTSNTRKEDRLDDAELKLGALYAEYEEYKKSLPLTENEKKQIIKPLSVLLKDVNVQTTPGNALLIAVGMVMLPRLLPLGINKMMKPNP
ncbi:MAG: hypothetical protein IPM95_06955 [Sphingobacteriales bacterium]|nr:hypothetical protein [Sphingobacteriales bacterium]